MTAQAVAQVAEFLKVSPNQIKRCEEWSNVLFVQVLGLRPRFVSKKVLVAMETFEQKMERLEREQDENAAKAEAMAATINDALPISHCVEYEKLFSAAIDVLEGAVTLEEVVSRFSSKKVVRKK